jgi:hypothetical protein
MHVSKRGDIVIAFNLSTFRTGSHGMPHFIAHCNSSYMHFLRATLWYQTTVPTARLRGHYASKTSFTHSLSRGLLFLRHSFALTQVLSSIISLALVSSLGWNAQRHVSARLSEDCRLGNECETQLQKREDLGRKAHHELHTSYTQWIMIHYILSDYCNAVLHCLRIPGNIYRGP